MEEVQHCEFEEDVSRRMEGEMHEWWDAYCLGCMRVTFPDSVNLQNSWMIRLVGIVVQIGDSQHVQYKTIVSSWQGK